MQSNTQTQVRRSNASRRPVLNHHAYVAVTDKGRLALNKSGEDIRQLFHKTEQDMRLHIIRVDAYEDVDAARKIPFLRNLLVNAASNAGLRGAAELLQHDEGARHILIEAVSYSPTSHTGFAESCNNY